MSGGYPNIKAAKRRAERIYPGISAAWAKTGVTRRQAKNYLDRIGHNLRCTFCGKSWHQVELMVTQGKGSICDACVRELSEMIDAGAGQRA
jgi:ribosomal protein L44E